MSSRFPEYSDAETSLLGNITAVSSIWINSLLSAAEMNLISLLKYLHSLFQLSVTLKYLSYTMFSNVDI